MDLPSIFPLGKSQCFVEKGFLLCSGESVFSIKGFGKKGFFPSKSQWKGVSFKFGERSYVLPTAVEWRDRESYSNPSTLKVALILCKSIKASLHLVHYIISNSWLRQQHYT